MSSSYISLYISPCLSLGSTEIRVRDKSLHGHLRSDPICGSEGPERMKEGRRERINIVIC